MMWFSARGDAGMRFAMFMHQTITKLVSQYLQATAMLLEDETHA